ncbi:outer membrane receptor proteins [Nonlabens ulvanivorans]|uniref:Outer membrane receptor proteins n=1 Tax=Nonlabens ulvanivorans TaxID=906888 RepID=A0A081DGL9_NONUL|nr:TonB-dependent receptor [Nonlabens ulvanivorans]GAK78065.1 outer membrane receptor proteins [Nonlabens ulvanivorans]
MQFNSRTQLVLFLFLFLTSITVFAHSIKGYVTDENGRPIKDLYILQKGTENHTHTNSQGFFSIDNVDANQTLLFSHVGFESNEILIEDPSLVLQVIMTSSSVDLDAVVISNDVDTFNTLALLDLQINPVNSSQEILQTVPGLFIGQHAGGGKAEQLFLRGFDIDHGTDVAIGVDGMPVNMVSHAHGQGYADLHFLIPETINSIDYGKGSYDASKGNFATAGHVNLNTKEFLQRNLIQTEIGDFNYQRLLSMFNVVDNSNTSAYVATEYITFDGPFDSPQNFDRFNIFSKLNHRTKTGGEFNLTASYFTSEWDASGQIPERAVASGLIGRFGAIDDTEGGSTSRTNLNLTYNFNLSDTEQLKTQAYYTHYNFELFSNFTFFLEDPLNGDQIKQQESRDMIGINAVYNKEYVIGDNNLDWYTGISLRNDRTDGSSLARTLNRRTTLEQIQLGDINETNSSLWTGLEYTTGNWNIDAGIRLEHFKFVYRDGLDSSFDTLSQDATALLPKLNLAYQAGSNWQLYLKNGIGLHSNDTRVVIQNEADKILPKSYGSDLGTIFKPTNRLVVNTALWYLYLEQEFVYVGDAGIVEPSGKTERYGFDLGLNYQLTDYLFLDTNLNYAHARAIEEASGEDYIPLAPEWTSTGGLSLKNYNGWNASLRYRYIADRAANEDNSIIAEGYFVNELNLNYDFSKRLNVGFTIENLFDVEWNETQFATETRLLNETASVEEIHFTPGTPFFIKGRLVYSF